MKRCRVLEESGCVSVCKNVCKIPTETFFTEKVGLPVTLIQMRNFRVSVLLPGASQTGPKAKRLADVTSDA